MSYLPENNPEAFGDRSCNGGHYKETKYGPVRLGCSIHEDSSKHWGFRHWVYFAAGLTFAIWNVVEVINEANKQKIKP